MATTGLSRDRIGEIIRPSSEGSKARKQDSPNFVHIRDCASRDEKANLRAFEEEDLGGVCKLWASLQRHVVLSVTLTCRI
jgi:hypothetical protein